MSRSGGSVVPNPGQNINVYVIMQTLKRKIKKVGRLKLYVVKELGMVTRYRLYHSMKSDYSWTPV